MMSIGRPCRTFDEKTWVLQGRQHIEGLIGIASVANIYLDFGRYEPYISTTACPEAFVYSPDINRLAQQYSTPATNSPRIQRLETSGTLVTIS